MRENFSGGRVIVTATSFDTCQAETMAIMDDIENGSATFTMPVQQANDAWVSTGRIIQNCQFTQRPLLP